ncbi:MAG: tRNA preQ1(34) S-adenosylmethionine ribosyltransferase-isomerase QueA [Pseudomonadota bacterium]
MRVDEFDFELPESLIALRPADPRDSARLLRVDGERLSDDIVSSLPDFLQAGDLMVFNDTRVIPAQFEATRLREGAPGAQVGLTMHMRTASDSWKAFVRGAKKIAVNDHIQLDVGFSAVVIEKSGDGEITLKFDRSGSDLDAAFATCGHVPLPPYIASKRPEDAQDRQDYQTIYAEHDGAVAAPTAGLHFTPSLLEALDQRGVNRGFVTLHVGAGTFLPVKANDTDDHKMHAEIGVLGEDTAALINETKKRGARIISVGTTSLRLLETAATEDGNVHAWSGATNIFITPGYRFKCVDMLMTNFHLPRSTLIMLVSAFIGLEETRSAYRHAIENSYRFYSYGDSSLLTRKKL